VTGGVFLSCSFTSAMIYVSVDPSLFCAIIVTVPIFSFIEVILVSFSRIILLPSSLLDFGSVVSAGAHS